MREDKEQRTRNKKQKREPANRRTGEPANRNQASSIKHLHSVVHRPSSIVVAVLLLALILRLVLWAQPLHLPANDEIEYIAVARDLLAGRGWQFYNSYDWLRAPLYPLWLAGSLWLAGGDLHHAALPNIVLSVATVYLTYRLARVLAGPRAALLAALLSATLWTLATFASLYMAETLFTFLFTAGLLCLVGGRTTNDERRKPASRAASSIVRRPSSIAVAGVFFGLATLTRSITLLFLPIIAFWLLLRTNDEQQREKQRAPAHLRTRSATCSLLFILCSVLTIAPWTARNYVAYGRVIPVETGLSYNLWYFSEPREDVNAIRRALRSIPNPAERSDYATAQGLARLREDPAILRRKLWPNWHYLLRVRPIQDRFIQENYKSDVQLPLFAAALIFDDLLYLVILLAGTTGLILYQNRQCNAYSSTSNLQSVILRLRSGQACNLQSTLQSPKALCIAWICYVVATTLLTHAEARYRHFLFPVLIPYAAWALTQLVSQGFRVRLSRARWRGGMLLALGALLLWTVLGSYPWNWASQNVARGWHVLAGDVAWQAGDQQAALDQYTRATAAQRTPDSWLRIGDLHRAQGQLQDAGAAYRRALRVEPSYVPASARLGDVLRQQGEDKEARRAFQGFYTSDQATLDWAWRNLRPVPRSSIDVGDGLDFGYVGGMYPAEQLQGTTARWTDGDGMLRLSIPARAAPREAVLRLRLAAPRPDEQPAAAQICVNGQCWPLSLGAEWRSYALPFAAPPDGTLLIVLRSSTFAAPDGRALGVLVDEASVR